MNDTCVEELYTEWVMNQPNFILYGLYGVVCIAFIIVLAIGTMITELVFQWMDIIVENIELYGRMMMYLLIWMIGMSFDEPSHPTILHERVWNTHVGEHIVNTVCLCCLTTEITPQTFHCARVVEDGGMNVSNLVPICMNCM